VLPKNYEKDQLLDIYVGQLESDQATTTFDFYMLNWCDNGKGLGYDKEKYGVTLSGTPMHESPYRHIFGQDQNMRICKKTLTHGEVE
jgi:hypothetical protein